MLVDMCSKHQRRIDTSVDINQNLTDRYLHSADSLLEDDAGSNLTLPSSSTPGVGKGEAFGAAQ